MAKKILVYQIGRTVEISDRLHAILCVYKVMWPPETTVAIGKKVVALKEFTPWPPPEQIGMGINVPTKPKEKPEKKDLG